MPRRGDARQRLVLAAYGLFRRGGFHGTSLADVTGAAGMARGSFSFHFPGGKDELAAAVVAHAGENLAGAIKSLQVDRDLTQVVDALFVAVTEELVASGYRAGCAVAGVTLDAWIPETAALLEECARSFARWVHTIGRVARRQGLGADDAESLAWLIVTLLEGGLVLARAGADPRPLDLARARALAAVAEATAPLDAVPEPTRSGFGVPARPGD